MKTSLNTNQLLSQMQQLTKLVKQGTDSTNIEGLNSDFGTKINPDLNSTNEVNSNFGTLFTQAINSVNHQQMEAGQLANQVETGDGGVSLVKAMIASQKANVAFQATVQVRNRIVSAYQDIMNMPI